MELYFYQDNAISEAAASFKNYLRQLLVMPTGSGKTIVFSEIVRRAILKQSRILVLTDRKELHKQCTNAVKYHNIAYCEITDKSKVFYEDALLFIGMVETVARRIEKLKPIKFDLIIIDEAHKGNFFKILDQFTDVKTLGCTATPTNKRLFEYYQNLIQPIDISELIERGFLTPARHYQMQDDFKDLEIKGGEYSEKSLFNHFNKQVLYGGVIEEYSRRCRNKKAIVFCVNVRHVIETYNNFKTTGYSTYYVHSEMKENERDYMIKAFEEDANGIMVNCGILCTGYDHPPIEVIIVLKKTLSLALWLQMCGRGGRIYDNKNYFTILDFGMNCDAHGLWDEPRKWELKPKKKSKSFGSVAATKNCDKCKELVSTNAKKCTHCGHIFPEQTITYKVGKMQEVKSELNERLKGKKISDLNLDELEILHKSKKYNIPFIWRVVRTKGHPIISEYARRMGYKIGWVEKQLELSVVEKNDKTAGYKDYLLK